MPEFINFVNELEESLFNGSRSRRNVNNIYKKDFEITIDINNYKYQNWIFGS